MEKTSGKKTNIRNFVCAKTIERTPFKGLSFAMSVRLSAWNNSDPIERIFMKFYTRTPVFFENVWRKFKFDSNLTRITGTLPEYLYTFMTTSCWILLRMRYVSDQSCKENQNTLFMFNFLPKIVPFMRWGKIWYSQTDHIWQYNTAYARCASVAKATNTLVEYVTFIAFPRQQSALESDSMLSYTRISFLLNPGTEVKNSSKFSF